MHCPSRWNIVKKYAFVQKTTTCIFMEWQRVAKRHDGLPPHVYAIIILSRECIEKKIKIYMHAEQRLFLIRLFISLDDVYIIISIFACNKIWRVCGCDAFVLALIQWQYFCASFINSSVWMVDNVSKFDTVGCGTFASIYIFGRCGGNGTHWESLHPFSEQACIRRCT